MTVPSPYQQSWTPGFQTQPPPGFQTQPPDGDRKPQRIAGALIGLLVTPIGIGLIAYGGYDMQRHAMMFARESAWLGAGLVLVGALVLLGVAVSGVVSGAGPIVGGTVWGILPGLVSAVAPMTVQQLFFDIFGGGPVLYGVLNWLLFGTSLVTGVLLAGAGVTAALVRRRR